MVSYQDLLSPSARGPGYGNSFIGSKYFNADLRSILDSLGHGPSAVDAPTADQSGLDYRTALSAGPSALAARGMIGSGAGAGLQRDADVALAGGQAGATLKGTAEDTGFQGQKYGEITNTTNAAEGAAFGQQSADISQVIAKQQLDNAQFNQNLNWYLYGPIPELASVFGGGQGQNQQQNSTPSSAPLQSPDPTQYNTSYASGSMDPGTGGPAARGSMTEQDLGGSPPSYGVFMNDPTMASNYDPNLLYAMYGG